MNMKILLPVLALSFAVIMAVAVVAPTLANNPENDSNVVVSGEHGEVILQLPSGLPSHPTNLRIVANDFDKKSAFGAHDGMLVFLWIPAYNGFMPVAAITDNSDPAELAFLQKVWNMTPIWLPPLTPNIITVEDKGLDVWRDGDVINVNLTTAVKITLPFDLMVGTPYQSFGNQTFILPPLSLTFREIAHGFHYESTTLLPHPPLSGYTIKVTSWQTPAWVLVEIPSWFRSGQLEVTGHICTHFTETFIPPAV